MFFHLKNYEGSINNLCICYLHNTKRGHFVCERLHRDPNNLFQFTCNSSKAMITLILMQFVHFE